MTHIARTCALALLTVVAMSAIVDTAAAAKRPIRTRRARPGHYIVVLKPMVFSSGDADERRAAVASEVDRLLWTAGRQVDKVYANTITGFSAELSKAEAKALARDTSVDYVISDAYISVTQDADAGCSRQDANVTWGLDRIDDRVLPRNNVYRYGQSGRGVNVYVLDTGIYPEHVDFEGRAEVAFDAVGGNGIDCNGHGTHVAATIAGKQFGVAKQARVFGVRVLGCNGAGMVSDIIEGIDWVTGYHLSPAVANMSFGTKPGDVHQALDDAVRASIASGVTYVAAAGNDKRDAATVSPARVPDVITVGATNDQDYVASFSNYGAIVDIFAPGQNVLSASIGGPTKTTIRSGTSMSAPHVSGVAAAFLELYPNSMPADVAEAVRVNGTVGVLSGVPKGTANRLVFASRVCTTSTTTTSTSTTSTTIVRDADGDGDPAGSDCNDAHPGIRHGAFDVCGNGVDEDCVGGDVPCPDPLGLCYFECWKRNGQVSVNDQTFGACRNLWHPICEGATWGGIKNKLWRQNGTANWVPICMSNCN